MHTCYITQSTEMYCALFYVRLKKFFGCNISEEDSGTLKGDGFCCEQIQSSGATEGRRTTKTT